MPESFALSQKELLALALEASQRDDRGHCMMYLKEATARLDASADACFMLGSEYAQLQLFDDACTLMQQSLDIKPGFSIARFQLGLLYLTKGQADEAQRVWEPLSALGDEEPLAAFHKGLCLLIQDDFVGSVNWLERGIALNAVNPALNIDMQMVIDQTRKLRSEADSKPEPAPALDEGGNQLFLNVYSKGKIH